MNYAFHIDLGEMSYDKWHAMYSAPENKAKRADWWGPEHVGRSGENSAVILAPKSFTFTCELDARFEFGSD